MEALKREWKKKKTKEKLLASAIHLIKTNGFDATSVEQITRFAKVGKGTFYNYFNSKEAVAVEYSQRGIQELLLAGRQEETHNAKERLGKMLREWAEFMVENKEVSWIAVRNRDEVVADASLHYGIMGIIKKGQISGEISLEYDPGFMAESLEGMMLQHFVRWYINGQGDLKQEMQRILSIFFEGMADHQRQA